MKVLMIDTAIVNYGDDRGGIVEEAGTVVDVPKAVASDLAKANRALYMSRGDDHSKTGYYTVTDAMVKAIKGASAGEPK